jgi:hypothetical protein
MSQIIGVVAPAPVVQKLDAKLADLSGIETEVDDWNGDSVYLNAPFNPPTPDSLVLLSVEIQDSASGERIASELVALRADLLLLDASTGAELGRVDATASTSDALAAIRRARPVD